MYREALNFLIKNATPIFSHPHLLVAAVGDVADAGALCHFGTQWHVTSC